MLHKKISQTFSALLFGALISTTATAIAATKNAAPIIPQPIKLKISEGKLSLNPKLTIYYSEPSLQGAAEVLAHDLLATHKIEAELVCSKKAKAGSILLSLAELDKNTDYQLQVESYVEIVAPQIAGIHNGAVSLVQAINSTNQEAMFVPQMSISDTPFRPMRGIMIDIKNQWHSVADIKQFIRLCRFYKVNYISLHEGDEQWISSICKQTASLTPEQRSQHRLYTIEEMDEIIRYGLEQGVYLLPHNLTRFLKANSKDFVEGDEYAGFMDELIGGGAYTGDGDDERYWAMMDTSIERSIKQFSKSYPDGVLPYFHIGAVQGEGGMSSATAAKITKLILKHSPKTKMLCWNGISATDPNLGALKNHVVICYYQQWGGGDIIEYLENGWDIINTAFSPLYIVGRRSQYPKNVFNDWNTFRTGNDGFVNGIYSYNTVKWTEFADKGKQSQVVGSLFSTWEILNEDHMPQVLPRLPAYADNVWNYRPWPYPETLYADYKARYDVQKENLKRFLAPPVAPDAVINAAASDAAFKDSINVRWLVNNDNAVGYRIYRGTSSNVNSAKPIAEIKELTFIDQDVKPNSDYYYWVEAFNFFGTAQQVGPLKGRTGEENKPAHAYEGFDYAQVEELHQEGIKSSAFGWSTPWVTKEIDPQTELTLVDGLSYGKLPVNGKALRIKHQTDKKGLSLLLSRHLSDKVGTSGTSTWGSFLIHSEKIGNGHFFFPLAGAKQGLGKGWDGNFAGQSLTQGKTEFVVFHFSNTEGKDRAYIWLNPALDKEPEIDTAATCIRTLDLQDGKSSEFGINNQPHGCGIYVVDEFRIGTSWKDVIGGADLTSPTPYTMTWEVPPMAIKSAPDCVEMVSAVANDESGVQYYFKEVSGHPGGSDSGWQDSNHYRDKGLQKGYVYQYQVKARDKSDMQNETEFSDIQEVELGRTRENHKTD